MAIKKDDLFKKVRYILDHYDGILNGSYRYLFFDFLKFYNDILALVEKDKGMESNRLIFLRNLPKFRSAKSYSSINLRRFWINVILDGDMITIDMDRNRKEVLDACKNYLRFVKNFQ